jgi:type I restriction-modification system DNA methylase subunit
MNSQDAAYAEIERLVKKFKDMTAVQRKSMNEDATRLGLILPMFRALGWDIENVNEVSPEEKVSRGWVDFSFRIGNVPRYFLETKRASEDLNDPRWVKQAIDYSWTKSVTWALLSDFEGLKVFNAEWKEENPFRAQFIEFNVDTYLGDFNRLWWLSRAETAERRLDAEAEKVGKKDKRQPVSQILFDDLKTWRGKLSKDLTGFNSISTAEADNAVLRMLNRLIFIRTAEDRDVESPRLLALIREMKDKGQVKDLSKGLSALFREMDGVYNSELFAPHSSEGFYVTPSVIEEVITGLYERNFVHYNFNAMDADVLGTVYEQYLGAVVTDQPQETKVVAKQDRLIPEEGLTVQDRRKKRKSQGIYYTPAFVTKYIVQQTVGRYLDEHGYHPHPPRVLDMACGSGSFLIEAFDVIDKYVMNTRGQARRQTSEVSETSEVFDRARQLEVLQSCIFGVDKDKQAVDVARLNLLLRALHSREKLPMLENIHHGDSLHPETWNEVAQTLKASGEELFDVIIGNPPYVRPHNLPEETKQFLWDNYSTFVAKADLYTCFIERAINLLKPGGLFAFIVSDGWLRLDSFQAIRQYILENCKVVELVNMPDKVFEDAMVKTSIFVFQKELVATERANNQILVLEWPLGEVLPNLTHKTQQSVFEKTPRNVFDTSLSLEVHGLKSKIEKDCVSLSDVVEIKFGLKTGDDEKFIHSKAKTKNHKPLLRGENIHRYELKFAGEYVWYVPVEMREHRKTARPGEPERFEQPKILVRDTGGGLECTLDTENYYVKDVLVLTKQANSIYSLSYIVGLLNSHLMRYYYETSFPTLHVQNSELAVLPIRRIDFGNAAEKSAHDGIVKSVEKMLALQKERQSVRREDDLDRARSLDRKIASVDEEIDRKVYELYGLTEDEVKIVEGG